MYLMFSQSLFVDTISPVLGQLSNQCEHSHLSLEISFFGSSYQTVVAIFSCYYPIKAFSQIFAPIGKLCIGFFYSLFLFCFVLVGFIYLFFIYLGGVDSLIIILNKRLPYTDCSIWSNERNWFQWNLLCFLNLSIFLPVKCKFYCTTLSSLFLLSPYYCYCVFLKKSIITFLIL